MIGLYANEIPAVENRREEDGVKKLLWRGAFPILMAILAVPSPAAEDLGWLQPGVRIWYVGAVGEVTFNSNAQEADLIAKFENGSVYVRQQQALVNWTSPLPSTEWINPDPNSEGVFWIHPSRLKAMNVSDIVSWLGKNRSVKARTSYTFSTLPFLKLLPMEELFSISPTREIVILIDANDASGGEYYFDVETGLLVSKTEALGGTRTMLSIAEINYSFTLHAAYPEDNGPHTAFAGRFSGARSDFLDNQGFRLDSMVISRHVGGLLLSLNANLMNVTTGQYYPFDNYLAYDFFQNTAKIRSITVEDWRTNGDHLFWWIPPAHLTNAKIRVWDQDLANGGTAGGVTTFSTADLSQSGFPSLSFDARGYLTDMTVNVPAMQIYIDTRLAPSGSAPNGAVNAFATTKSMRVDGLQYYLEQMTPGIPQGQAPSIKKHPASLNIFAGQTAEFTVTTDGNPPPAYEWRNNGTALSDGGRTSGSRTPTLTITNAQLSDSGKYSVFVSNTQGNATSSEAILSVTLTTPVISLSRSGLRFASSTAGASTSAQSVIIGNAGGGTLAWTATPSAAWITASPGSGTGGGTVAIGIVATGLAAGTYTGSVDFTDPSAANSPQAVTVSLRVFAAGGTTAPFGDFATPIDGALNVSGAIPVTGWALDDIQVTKVEIWRDPVLSAGEVDSLYYIGDGLFVEGARPDIETGYPDYPFNYTAGWGYMLLTNFLPNQGNGTYKLYAIATDKDGHVVTLGTKTITCDNAHAVKPFGTIDTPAQGGTASGNRFVNFGWVLTPMPKTVPKDGHLITVYVDSVLRGNLSTPPNLYNAYRVGRLEQFPGLEQHGRAGSGGGPVGAFFLDTTGYANGVHTIWWIAYDNDGQGDGIGSRYFSIANTGGSQEPARAAQEAADTEPSSLPVSFSPVLVKTGYDLIADFLPRYPDAKGVIRIEIPEVNRVEIELGEGADAAAFKPGRARFSGRMVVGKELRPLPIGSTLDSRTGRFSWMPGPGFLGDYRLLFIQDGEGIRRGMTVVVRIRPKL